MPFASSEPLHVLLVDDDEDDYALTGDLVSQIRVPRKAELQWASSYEAGLEALGDRRSDVCLLDYRLGARDGIELLTEVRSRGCLCPIILLTGKGSSDTDTRAMERGADDYLVKGDLSVPLLERSIRYALERARHVEALRASEQRYRRIVETTTEGVWLIDANSKTTFVNARLAQMLGYTPEEMLSRPFSEFMDDEGRAASAESLQRRRHGISEQYDRKFKRKDGSDLWVRIASNPVFDEAGRYDGALAMVSDLSGQKRDEAAKAALEGQLRQSQKMEAIGRLAGGVAHDFNNVLSVILSYGEMLLADMKPGDPMRADVEEIRKAGKRAADLTRQLLMFSRQQVLAPKVLDLNEVLASMDKMLQRILGADVDLVSLPTQPVGRVRVDPSSMEQVIMNLVVNARDAMPTGGKLTMETDNVVLDEEYARAHLGVTPGPHVMLAVTDTGTGMDKATLARMFDPFFTTKGIGKGTGLGLSTVFGIVQQSGGSVWVYSELGTGTTFKVYLPRVDAAVDATGANEAPTTLRGSETILLVEDDDQVRAVARGILLKSGYHVIEARNAGEALLHSEKHPGTIHLLLSDVVMPQMSGPELAKRLAKTRPDMRVLCMSGYTDDSIVRHGVLEAHLAYLQKPFTPDMLTTRVREVLQGARSP